jgi:hypothetical protein
MVVCKIKGNSNDGCDKKQENGFSTVADFMSIE